MCRITGYTSPEGTVSYTYDANSNVLTVNDSHGTITRTYDALNRVSSYTDTYGKVIRYGYDAVGNLSKLIYPDNTAVTYAYDANHQFQLGLYRRRMDEADIFVNGQYTREDREDPR